MCHNYYEPVLTLSTSYTPLSIADKPSVAGKPAVLVDPTDPRLLKHSPLPLSAPVTSSPNEAWATNYRDTYTSPVQGDYATRVTVPSPPRVSRFIYQVDY